MMVSQVPPRTLGKTLVTGISGFLAGALTRTLASSGVEVIGIGRNAPSSEMLTACNYAPCDVRDFDTLSSLIHTHRPDTVFHLAAYATLTAGLDEGPRALLEVNVAGTWNVLEACRCADVPVVVVASSDKQYGSLATPPYDDDDSTAFENGGLYELSKAQQDQVARLYAGLHGTPAIRVARLVNLYGPGDLNWTRIVPGTIHRTFYGEAPRLTAGRAGAALREYLFVDDCIHALCALATDAQARGNAPCRRDDGRLARVGFNVVSGHHHSAGEVIEIVQNLLRDAGIVGPPPQILPRPGGVWEPGSQFGKADKLRSLLPDWSPRPLQAGLRATIPWYLDYLRAASARAS